ncbi:HAMP domain-containing histidine kinase [Microbulbifer salipaludis]|uniref:histidine kinase n=1 Tax=Microbulbifer salipaludis TaxID=187980 RepID=A0ABS3E4M5_9GAMM|nr:HAMP domain-containing histidine kinase [Microbulbifer salipaludis]
MPLNLPPPSGDQAIITNLRRLTALRAIALLAYIAVSLWLGDTLSGGALVFVALGLVTTLVSGWRARGSVALGRLEFFGHLLMDWLWLPPLLAFSGGAANPFVTYLLVPLTIAAATQPRLYTWVMAAISIATYTGLILFFPGIDGGHSAHAGHDMGHGMGHGTDHDSSAFYRHLIGMWATFAFSALLIAGFVNSMAEALRSRDRHLHTLRQEQARRDQVLSLGTLAAGTAHELASPLQTIGLLVEELQAQQQGFAAPVVEDLALLQQQVNLCKQALEQLKSRARDPAGSEEFQSVKEFIARSLERWQLLRPEARFALTQQGPENVRARLPLTLEQTFINVLNNALDANLAGAATQPVEIDVLWSEQGLVMAITDSGGGVHQPQPDPDSEGFGIGLILSKTALIQLGGSLTLAPRTSGQGTIATIELPLESRPVEEV